MARGGFKLKAILLTQFPKCSHHAWLLHSFSKVFRGTRFFKHPLRSSTLSTRESSLAAHTARTFSVQGITLSLCLLPRQSLPITQAALDHNIKPTQAGLKFTSDSVC